MKDFIEIISNLQSALMSIFAVFGGITAILGWISSIKIKRAEYLSSLYDKLNNNKTSLYFSFLYNYIKNNSIYNNDFFSNNHNSKYNIYLDWKNKVGK